MENCPICGTVLGEQTDELRPKMWRSQKRIVQRCEKCGYEVLISDSFEFHIQSRKIHCDFGTKEMQRLEDLPKN